MKSPELAELSARMLELRERLTAAYYDSNCNSQDPRVTSLSREFDRLCNDWIRLHRFDQIPNQRPNPQ